MKPSNTLSRPLPRTPRPLGLQRGAEQPRPCKPHTPDSRRGSQALPAPQRGCSGSRDGWEDVAPKKREKSLTWKPWVCRSAPRDAGSSTQRGPFQVSLLLCEGPGASPRPQPVVRRWPSGRREQGYRSSGPPSQARRQRGYPSAEVGATRRCPGSGFAVLLQGSAPRLGPYSHHPRPPAAVVAQDPRSSAEDLHPRADAFVPLTDPLHHSEQRESPLPAPASYQLRSHA